MADEWLERGAAEYDSLKKTAVEPWVSEGAKEYDRITGGKVQMSLDFGLKQNPDSHAQTQKSAKKLNIPIDLAERNADEINGIVNRNDIYEKIQDTEYLKKAFQNPNFASIAHDDVDALSKVENSLSRIRGPEPGYISTMRGLHVGAVEGFEKIRQGIRMQWADLIGSERMRSDAERKYAAAETKTLRFDPEFESSTMRGVYGGLTSLTRQAPALIASVAAKSPALALGAMGQSVEAEAYGKYRARGASPEQAFLGGVGEGAVEVATELMPMGFLVSKFGKTGMGDFLTGILAREVPGEQVATIVQDAIDAAIANPDKTWGDYIKERPEAAYETLIATLVQSGIVGGVSTLSRYGSDINKSQDALNSQEALDGQVEIVNESKLKSRSPEEMKKFLDEVVGAEEEVFLSPEDAEVFFQSNPEVLETLPPEVQEHITEALATSGDVVIQKSDYLTYLSEYHDQLTEVIRNDMDGMNAKEANEWVEQGNEQFEAEAERILAEQEMESEFRTSAETVATKIKEQIVQTGRFTEEAAEKYSQLHKAFAATVAERTGQTPEQVYEQFGLEIRGVPILDREGAIEKLMQAEPARDQPTEDEVDAFMAKLHEAHRAAQDKNKERYERVMAGLPYEQSEIDTFYQTYEKPALYQEGMTYDKEGIAKIDTPEFKRWFGESKVIDESGKPEVVHHGGLGAASIEQFDAMYGGQTTGNNEHGAFHFTENLEVAEDYGRQSFIRRYQDDPESLIIDGYVEEGFDFDEVDTYEFVEELAEDNIEKQSVYLSIENPYVMDMEGERIDVQQIENLSAAFKAASEGDYSKIPEEALDDFLEMGEFDKDDIDSYRDEINEKIIEDYDLESIDEAEEWQVQSAIDEVLTEEGIEKIYPSFDGIIIKNMVDDIGYQSAQIADQYIVFDPAKIKSISNKGSFDPADPRILYQREEAPRGQIQFDDGALITLLENADLSTFLHESGHFFFEAYKNLSDNPEIAQDMQTLLDFVEIDSLETWNSMSLEQRREGHEKVARAFEAYLFEGKAPNIEMQSLFARFRDWLLNVYQNLTKLNVELTDEVRQVFDRMLATKEQIREKEVARAYEPLFESAEEAGMTEKQWTDYQNMDERRRVMSESQLQTRSLKDMKWLSKAKGKALRELQKEAKDKRKAVRSEVSEEVSRETTYRAINFLKKGELDGVKSKEHKLDRDEFVTLAPNVKLPRGMTQKDGLSPDVVAEMLGFTSGDELIQRIVGAEPQKARIDRLTDERMLETYGDLTDPVVLERAAEEAIHNEAHTRFLHTELTSLTKRAATGNVLSRAAKQYAEEAISRKKIREIRPFQYSAAETRAAKNAEKAIIQGDRESAAEHKRAQVLNNHFFRAANNAQTETEKMVRYLKKFDREGTRKNIDRDYLTQIDRFLEQYELRKVSFKELDKRESLTQWITEQENLGFDPVVDEALLDVARKKNYRNMTFEELRGLRDSIKNIEHLGRLKNKMLRQKDKREFSARMAEADESIRVNANRRVKERGTPSDVLGKMGSWARNLAAIHRKSASILREMDGGKDNGVMYNLLTRGASESGDNETELTMRDAQIMADIFQPVMGDIHKDGIPGNIYAAKKLIPGTDFSMAKEEVLMFGMNWGNEGNRQRLLDGGMVGRESISNAEAQAILDTLTEKDLTFIQGVLDHIGSKRDEIAAQEKRLTGVEPQWIEAVPIVAKNGTIPGGYFPAKYDVVLSTRSETLDAANDLRMAMKGAFHNATTRKSYTQKRADEVKGRPIWLNFDTISRHMAEVNHRLSWQDWIVDANRTIKALDTPIREHYGPEILKELHDVVRDVTDGDMQAQHAWEQAVNRFRVGATIVGLGWRFSTALIQPSGLAQSWSRVGSGYMVKGIKQYLANPLKAGRIADAKSKMMRGRAITMQRETNEVLNTIRAGDKLSWFKASMFVMIQKMQRTVDIPTWFGAYEKALQELEIETAQNQKTRDSIEEAAIAIADQTVKDTQSSGMIFDLAKIQRGSPIAKLFTNFYSYFSATYNLNVETLRRGAKTPGEALTMAGDLLIINVAPVIFSVALKQMLKNECDMEIECLGEKLAEEQVSYLMGLTLPTRELGAGVPKLLGLETYEYKGPAGLRPFMDVAALQTQVSQGEVDKAFLKSANKVAGAVLHYPAGQLNNTIEGIMAIENGEVEGVGVVQALLAGPPR